MEYTIVVVAAASDPAPMQYIAPYSGCAMAEYFMYNEGKADALRLRRSVEAGRCVPLSSRSCFAVRRAAKRIPGDVFYLHSRLLERAAKLSEDASVVDGKTHPEAGRLADRAADHRDAGR